MWCWGGVGAGGGIAVSGFCAGGGGVGVGVGVGVVDVAHSGVSPPSRFAVFWFSFTLSQTAPIPRFIVHVFQR